MECPLCLDFYSDAANDYFVTTSNGHLFHYSCITSWSKRENSCPTCRQCSIQSCDLIRLRNLDTVRPGAASAPNPTSRSMSHDDFTCVPSAPPLSDVDYATSSGRRTSCQLPMSHIPTTLYERSTSTTSGKYTEPEPPEYIRHDYNISNTEVTLGKDNQIDAVYGSQNKIICYSANSTVIITGHNNSLNNYGERCEIIITGNNNSVQLYRCGNTVELKGNNNTVTNAGPNNTILDKGKNNKVKKY